MCNTNWTVLKLYSISYILYTAISNRLCNLDSRNKFSTCMSKDRNKLWLIGITESLFACCLLPFALLIFSLSSETILAIPILSHCSYKSMDKCCFLFSCILSSLLRLMIYTGLISLINSYIMYKYFCFFFSNFCL